MWLSGDSLRGDLERCGVVLYFADSAYVCTPEPPALPLLVRLARFVRTYAPLPTAVALLALIVKVLGVWSIPAGLIALWLIRP